MKSIGGTDASKKSAAPEKSVAAEAEKAPEKIDFSNVKIEPLFEEMLDFETFSKLDLRAVKVKACVTVAKSEKLLKFVLGDWTDVEGMILSGIHEYYAQ